MSRYKLSKYLPTNLKSNVIVEFITHGKIKSSIGMQLVKVANYISFAVCVGGIS